MSVSKQLQQAIASSGMSLYAVAKAAGLSYSTVHEFVNKGNDLRLSNVDRLADALGLELTAKGAKGKRPATLAKARREG